jgi:hypothetical protein
MANNNWGGKRKGAGAKSKGKESKTTSFRIYLKTLALLKELSISNIQYKVNNFLQGLVISERVTKLEMTKLRLDIFRDIVDSVINMAINDCQTFEDIIESRLLAQINSYCLHATGEPAKRTEEEIRQLYAMALCSFLEFLNDDLMEIVKDNDQDVFDNLMEFKQEVLG